MVEQDGEIGSCVAIQIALQKPLVADLGLDEFARDMAEGGVTKRECLIAHDLAVGVDPGKVEAVAFGGVEIDDLVAPRGGDPRFSHRLEQEEIGAAAPNEAVRSDSAGTRK